MQIGRKSGARSIYTKPNKNQSKKNVMLAVVVTITVLLIIWVYAMGRKAEDTISVVMWSTPIYKNQTITESMWKEYKMLKGEFEKYAVTADDGSKTRRIVLWDERDLLLNTYAAYSLQQDTVAMTRDVITSRTDNSDAVLYSFPGKNIVQLEVGSDALQSFKSYLEPGDRINITAIYKVDNEIDNGTDDETETVETIQQKTAFKDIMLADLLNSAGNSILDIYASYNEMTQYEQASLDADETFQDSVTPSTMLVALTPEEEALYYDYLSKDVEFVVSMPQRAE